MLTAENAARDRLPTPLPHRIRWLALSTYLCAALPASAANADSGIPETQALSHWQQLVGSSYTLTDQQKLRRTNRFFNQRIRFVSDRQAWQQADYWATPRETLLRSAGDCEDFSIAKYITLIKSGIPAKQLRLVYVKAMSGLPESALQQAHMVLAYYPLNSAEPLILDNLITDIQPASQRTDLTPLFSFNSEGLWVGGNRASRSPEAHLSRWRSVLQRMQQEGVYNTR